MDVGEDMRSRNIKEFTNLCEKDYKKSIGNLPAFTAQDLWPFSINQFQSPVDYLHQFIQSEDVSNRIQTLTDILKKKKRSKKMNAANLSAALSSQEPREMTEDDFMHKVLEELTVSEQNYVSDLEKIFDRYIRHLRARVYNGDVNDVLVLELFGNIEEMLAFQKKFLGDLIMLGNDINRVGDLGDLFTKRVMYFYYTYLLI